MGAGDREACRARIAGLRNEGPFTPPSERGTLVYPSSIGGAHWGGVTFDPTRQIAVVPVNRIPIEVRLIPRERFDRRTATDAAESRGPSAQYTDMKGTPYVMRRQFMFFIAAALDAHLRAFDIENGRELWKGALPASGKATPMTFRGPRDGRQYVVVAAGGDGEVFGWSDAIVAFRLREP